MGLRRFDEKFGKEFVAELTTGPAVYLFRDQAGAVLYVGKAKNIRRRLQGYRNASRRKAHRKMRTLVREAESIEIVEQPDEREALLVENSLIREHHPPYNFEATFSFLYPALGVISDAGRLVLCFTTSHETFAAHPFGWYGTFRSRVRAKEAFAALLDLLGRIGHIEPRRALARFPRMRGSRVVGIRRVDDSLVDLVQEFLAGYSIGLLEALALRLVEKPQARRDAAAVQQSLRTLQEFFEMDARPLCDALRRAERSGSFVPQAERDALFIAARFSPGEAGRR